MRSFFVGKLGKNHSGEHKSAAEQLVTLHPLAQEPPAAQGGEHGFQTHNQGSGGALQMLLTQNLHGVGKTHGQDAGKQQRPPAGKDIRRNHRFCQKHTGNGDHRHHQSLDAVEPDAVQLSGEPVDAGDLHRDGQGTAHQQKIPLVDPGDANAAEQKQAHDCKAHAEYGDFGNLLPQKVAKHRHKDDVHGCDEAGFARLGVDKPDLLQAGGNKQSTAADDTGFPERRIGPLFHGLHRGTLPALKNKGAGCQKQNRQQTPDGLKRKGPDPVHTHALGDEGEAPDDGCQQKTDASTDFFFHGETFLVHSAAAGKCFLRAEAYFTTDSGKMQGVLLFTGNVVQYRKRIANGGIYMEQFSSREQIPEKYRWALEDLYPGTEDWERELETLHEDAKTLESFQGKLGLSGENLCSYLDQLEKLEVKASNLGNYCMRKADEDTRSPEGQAMSGRFMNRMVEVSTAASFDTPEIMAIADDTLEGFYAACPRLERYRRFLTNLRRRKAHTLSAQEEKLLSSVAEVTQAPENTYSSLLNADMTFPDALDGQGVSHPVNHASFIALQQSEDRQLRRSAYESMYDTLGHFRNTEAALLNAQNKQLKFCADARKYGSTLEASLDSTNVPVAVYHNLIQAVHENLPKLHRYIRLRKKLMGLDELHFYDVYTPLVGDRNREIPFEEAAQTVYEALEPLGETYRAVLKEGLENRWVDVYPTPGKRSGAYSAGTFVHPFVLLNQTDTLNCQFTLAHEMGHALHSYFSNKTQNPLDADYVIFVAEVASTCNEALLMEHLLSKTTDRRERAYLINHFLEQFRGTLFRQTMFAEFELKIGQLTAQGQTLTADVLSSIYRELNEQYYGPDIVVDDRIALEWARIPHFYYNYYVFQYATGYAAAIALSRRILREGACAVRDYLNFLSGGCSKSPVELLKGAGVDMTTPEPVNQALALFDTLLTEMEALMGGN